MSSSNSFNDISIEEYSNFSIVVRGETRKYKEDLKKLGGKYNGRLSGEPGWIFSKRQQSDVENFISNGERLVTEQEARDGESRTQSFEREKQTSTSSQPTKKLENSNISLEIQRMSSRIDSLENLVKQLMSVKSKEQKSPKNITKVIKIIEPSDDSDDEECSKPMKRLLRN